VSKGGGVIVTNRMPGKPQAMRRRPLHAYVGAAAVMALVIFGLAACGGQETTGGTGVATAPPAGDLRISLTTDPNPPKAGPVTVVVEVKDAQGKPVDGAQVSVSINHTGMSHGGIKGDLTSQGSGRYQADGSFSMSGTWHADVEVTSQGGSATTQSFELQVGR
jgi:hypothetical protein